MKKLLILLILSLFIVSCEKEKLNDTFVPASEIPGWLKEKITTEQIAALSGQYSSLEVSAWIRYKFEGNYFFEYNNLLSSTFPPIYNFDGLIITTEQEPYLDYHSKKCCKRFVWKGSSYIDF